MLIQSELKAPKSQRNSFWNYNFRSCEDIMESVKPLLLKYNCIITLSDELIVLWWSSQIQVFDTKESVSISKDQKEIIDVKKSVWWERFYIKATATITDIEDNISISTCWRAREEDSKKGMDWSQVTWASSSYARKYALNWLLAIDDTKDSDATNNKWKDIKKDKKVFTAENMKSMYTRANGKSKWEVMQYVLKIQSEYTLSDEVKADMDLFLNSLT